VTHRRRRKRLHPATRWALDGLGVALFGWGAVNIFIPGMPTTIFWIGAVLCFLKTRPTRVRPMLRTPVIGPAIVWYLRWRPFAEGGGPFSAPSKRKRARRRLAAV
jgi:uncharacterized protein